MKEDMTEMGKAMREELDRTNSHRQWRLHLFIPIAAKLLVSGTDDVDENDNDDVVDETSTYSTCMFV